MPRLKTGKIKKCAYCDKPTYVRLWRLKRKQSVYLCNVECRERYYFNKSCGTLTKEEYEHNLKVFKDKKDKEQEEWDDRLYNRLMKRKYERDKAELD